VDCAEGEEAATILFSCSLLFAAEDSQVRSGGLGQASSF